MASYVVMRPPGDEGEEHAEFVRDGFSYLALVVPFVWLAWHKLWFEAALVILVAIALAFLGEAYPWARALSPLVTVLGFYVALEGGTLRVAALARRGWREAGIVSAASLAEAEIRWFGGGVAGARDDADEGARWPHAPVPAKHPFQPSGPALGLFSYPGNS